MRVIQGMPVHCRIAEPLGFFSQLWSPRYRLAHIGLPNSRPQSGGVRIYSASSKEKKSPKQETKNKYSFYADVGVSWTSLGLSNDISQATMKAGFDRPSVIQAASIPKILQGGDVVVAAETGSGKTHAYLLPILQLLERSHEEFIKQKSEQKGYLPRSFALVLCPNATLCQQAADMASGVCSNLEKPVKVAVITGGQGWPMSPPDIVVATPGALINHLFSYDPKRKRRGAFIRDARFVVFDEADMLLSGSFEKEVTNRLLPMLRLEEKRAASEEKGNNAELKVELAKPWTDFEKSNEEAESDEDSDMEEEVSEWAEVSKESTEASNENKEDKDNAKKKRKTYRKKYKRSKQYIFVAATLPVIGKKTPAIMLSYQFPDATWINGEYLHCHNPRVNHRWVEVDASKRVEALLQAISSKPDKTESTYATPYFHRTMVFANTIESLHAIERILEKVHVTPLCFHRNLSLEERTEAVKRFQDEGGILLCTDSGARGLDIKDIGHIIQAEFALNAVDFLHRVGRTGRAGKPGLVTSLYTEASHPLVEAVRQAIIAGQPVEAAFSRKRSFRNKLKKQVMQQNQAKEEATPVEQV